MISGAHVMIYTSDAEADRAFCGDVLGMPQVDAGDGWLIFGLPPVEDQGWGRLTQLTLPGGGALGVQDPGSGRAARVAGRRIGT